MRGDTKTKRSRELPLAPWVCRVLQAHRKAQLAQQAPGMQKGIVFPSKRGTYRLRGSLKTALTKAAQAAGIQQRVTPQVLRRTFNTLMLEAGVDRIVLRSMMGHCSEEMTEHYASIKMNTKVAAQLRVIQSFDSNVG